MKVHIATSREIGHQCIAWARDNLPAEAELTGDPEVADVFISVMYAHLVGEEFIAKRRCYNFHPGILPMYRGAGAFSWAIINGERECGITLHELDVDIDTGPVIEIVRFPVNPWDTAGTLHTKGMGVIYRLFRAWFARLLVGDYTSAPQGEGRTYYRRDLHAAADLTRFVRAFEFEGKEPAFYIDRTGKKIELRWG